MQKPLFHKYIVIVKQVNTPQRRLRDGDVGYNNKSNETLKHKSSEHFSNMFLNQ